MKVSLSEELDSVMARAAIAWLRERGVSTELAEDWVVAGLAAQRATALREAAHTARSCMDAGLVGIARAAMLGVAVRYGVDVARVALRDASPTQHGSDAVQSPDWSCGA